MSNAFSLRLRPALDELPPLRDGLRGWLEADGTVAEDAREDIVLAAWEAAANAVEHPVDGKGEINVTAEVRGGGVVVCVANTGGWQHRDEPREDRGLGLRLIAALMDRVQVQRTTDGTRVLMCRSLVARGH